MFSSGKRIQLDKHIIELSCPSSYCNGALRLAYSFIGYNYKYFRTSIVRCRCLACLCELEEYATPVTTEYRSAWRLVEPKETFKAEAKKKQGKKKE